MRRKVEKVEKVGGGSIPEAERRTDIEREREKSMNE